MESIGTAWVRYHATGSVDIILQWGSNSDLRNGNGAESEVPVEEPHDLSGAEVEWAVDTSSWNNLFGKVEYYDL